MNRLLSNPSRRLVPTVVGLLLSFGLQAHVDGTDTVASGEVPASGDTLVLRLSFKVGHSDYLEWIDGNAERLETFSGRLAQAREAGLQVSRVVVYSCASVEGSTDRNLYLSRDRADEISRLLWERCSVDPSLVGLSSAGEDWSMVEPLIEALDAEICPWKEEALSIVRKDVVLNFHNGQAYDDRKAALRQLAGGEAWKVFQSRLFPAMKTIPSRTVVQFDASSRDTVYLSRTDTVWVHDAARLPSAASVSVLPVEQEGRGRVRRRQVSPYHTEGQRMLMAFRTNALLVPGLNVGVEFPLGKHLSIGIDWNYPWLWRNGLHRECFQLQALDAELRWWAGRRRNREEQRLLGHSVGVYGAAGTYDFQRSWSGHQGRFINVGIDYMYACPLWDGRMHLEFELGVGYIYSPAVPYDCFEEGGELFRQGSIRRLVRWFGPTRAMISLVVPVYVGTGKKGGAR